MSVPIPEIPTYKSELLVQVEPAPVTVTVPTEPSLPAWPAVIPSKPLVLETAPPFAIVSAPVLWLPTINSKLLVQVEPAPVTVTSPSLPGTTPTWAPVLETAP